MLSIFFVYWVSVEHQLRSKVYGLYVEERLVFVVVIVVVAVTVVVAVPVLQDTPSIEEAAAAHMVLNFAKISLHIKLIRT